MHLSRPGLDFLGNPRSHRSRDLLRLPGMEGRGFQHGTMEAESQECEAGHDGETQGGSPGE